MKYNIINQFIELLTTDVTVIKSFGEGERPEKPYATWFKISNVPTGQTQTLYADKDDVFTERQATNKNLRLQIDVYNHTIERAIDLDIQNFKTSEEIADEITSRLRTYSSLKFQKENGFSVVNFNDISHQVAFLGDRNEDRAAVELMINTNAIFDEQSGLVDKDTINVNVTYEDL